MDSIKFRTFLCILFIGCYFFTSGQNVWTRKDSIIPPARAHAVGFSIGNKGYIAGGMVHTYPSHFYQQDFQEFDPVTNTWIQKPDLPHQLTNAVAFTIGPKAYIPTGYDTFFNCASGMLVWDTVQKSWSLKDIPQEIRRSNALGFSIEDKGYVALGYGSGYGGAYGLQNDMWEFDPSDNTWTRKADFPGVPRADAACFVIGNKVYITTGYPGVTEPGDTIPTNDLWEFDPNANTWAQKATFPGGIMRCGAVGFSIDNKGYIVAGAGPIGQPFYTDYWEFDPQQDSWMSMGRFPGYIRMYAAGIQMLNKGYIVSGWFFDFPGWTDVWEYSSSHVGLIEKPDPMCILSPNPFQDHITLMVRHPENGSMKLIIMDLTGSAIFADNVLQKTPLIEQTYDLQNLRRGIYIYTVTINNRIADRGKVIKE